ncbi:MAG: hypothetical protein K2W81_06875 [Sphingomonas sp.]|uniref:energy transducer TonB n=1 Tax=Sphingomonas sp. TaxID=28214 RepID=UPI0025F641AE|nr:hypothetical protein [Sphingomonas sp.]MBY0283672.1 hypothetical protein [Sphingomonas sp.]
MDSMSIAHGGYVPITNRRRAVSIAIVAALYALALLVLLTIWEVAAPAPPPDQPVVVTLLPLDKPPEPEAPRTVERPTERARTQAPQPADVRPVEPPPPVASANPLPAAAAPSPPAATGPITAGEGDAVYDLDSGGGGSPGAVPPRWVHKVTNDEFFPLVDEELLQASLEVDYRMQCTIALSTRVTCRVLKETPFYPGLRRAVLAAVPLLRMAPGKRDGRPIDGQRVEFLWRITVARGDVRLR